MSSDGQYYVRGACANEGGIVNVAGVVRGNIYGSANVSANAVIG